MMRLVTIMGIASLLLPVVGLGQGAMMPMTDLPYHWLDRLDVLYGNPGSLHMAVKGIPRRDIVAALYLADSLNPTAHQRDLVDWQWLADQNNEWQSKFDYSEGPATTQEGIFHSFRQPVLSRLQQRSSRRPIWKHLYQTPANLFEVNKGDFSFRVNPILNFRLARARDDVHLVFENQRGISLRGTLDDKVYFHSEILESQARYADYVTEFRRQFRAVPGAGLVKGYQSRVFTFNNGVDFLLANAYAGALISRSVSIELGHGRHFLGNGYRSLMLSDFSTDYMYLKLNTRIWKFHYQNIFGELLRPRQERSMGDQLIPKKYFATHYLSIRLAPTVDLGFFETVVFAREDQFELQYLNPVILYRTVEGAIGSPDNVMVGIDLKYNLLKRASFYSQFILDEFRLGEITSGAGWWANKFGLQVGGKLLDLFGISHLDAQLEYNTVRPYTYSHNTAQSHYSHYNQPLAHPLGANFREGLMRIRYQPNQQWFVTGRALMMITGEDRDTTNWGGNILLPNTGRPMDFGNTIAQGSRGTTLLFGFDVGYQIKHNLFLEAFFQYRDKDIDIVRRQGKTIYTGAGIRWNSVRRWNDF